MRSLPTAAAVTGLLVLASGAALAAPVSVAATSPSRAADLAAYRPLLETPTRFDDGAGGDADADDPAIYVNRARPAASVVLGTLKNGGLEAYDLRGRLLQHVDTPPAPAEGLEAGRFNNVDLLPRTRWGTLAVVTDRGRDRLRAYRVDRRGAAAGSEVLTDLTVARAPRLFSRTEEAVEEQNTGYGLALRQHRGTTYAVVSRRNRTALGLYRLTSRGERISYVGADRLRLPGTFTLADGSAWSPCGEPGEAPQVEGMVVDGVRDVLYAAQEDVGLWRIPLAGAGFGEPRLVQRVREFGRDATYDPATEECTVSGTAVPDSGEVLSADAEGLTLVTRGGRPVQLVASSQGDDTFARFTLRGRHLGGFEVVAAGGVDGVQESDGAALTTTPLGPRFPRGLLVVHDGQATPTVTADGEVRASSNFKLVPWR